MGMGGLLALCRRTLGSICTVITYSRVWIKRVRLPILLVVNCTGRNNISLSPYVPENLVSRDGFSRPVPRQPAHLHTQAESGAYLRDYSRVLRRRPFIYFKPPSAIGPVPSLSGHAIAYRWRSLPRVAGTGPLNPKVVPNECCLGRSPTMDQLICECHRYAIASPDKLRTDPMADGGINK